MSFAKRHTILLTVAFVALLTFALAVPVPGDLVARVKLPGAKPPAQPPKKPVAPAPAPAKPAPPPASPCNGAKDPNGNGNCQAFAIPKNACAFDRTTLKCVPRPGTLTSTLVTVPAQCATIQQTSRLTPNANVQQQAAAEFARMQNHIFNGETDPTSGRHTFNAWRKANSDPGRCDNETHLCAFRLNNKTPKTVWDDRAGLYTQQDIKDMCMAAITLNIQENQMKSSLSFSVQTKFGKSICVEHLVTKDNTPSCFPVGIHRSTPPLGSRCTDTGSGKTATTVEIAQGQK
ncbi:unnamed protein product [Somion occarium]|uniref:Uncharacterized protein n=1 Tax=Somion occarium TaxID=3059160 RepID=A0ABP1E6F0_9APHY